MYKSPIDIVYGQMQTQMEGDILRAVQSYGINVDKDELVRALQYDRDQYYKGYDDATPKWIPVTERLPEKTGLVLGYDIGFGVLLVYYEVGVIRSGWQSITHWMPLPEPSKT